ncbi:MAG: acetyl-CoA carboxylase carboxyltransferase subunit beta [Alphaproteobacteria bacterium GM7ARS4]|nr:acetyl-CoA carboxylase carboxyltransferase subunit beta [Alphaproteobacteria bacterium GM7ARS4]
MNWLRNLVRPKIRAIAGRDVPENLWVRCDKCTQMIFHSELVANLHVCPYCQNHMRIDAKQRLAMLFDDGQYTPIALPNITPDPLRFRDSKRYSDRLRTAKQKMGRDDGTIVARGNIEGILSVVAVMDFFFIGGSMGIACGEALLCASQEAIRSRAPLIAVCASGGARMQESTLSLVQMARTVIAVKDVKDASLPYITLLTDPTTGGVSASFAMLGDMIIAEPGALIGFAGSRVIEETIKEKLPEGFQRAEFLLDHGMLDMVVARKDLKATLGKTLSILLHRPVSS